jgi:hypothetical protein
MLADLAPWPWPSQPARIDLSSPERNHAAMRLRSSALHSVLLAMALALAACGQSSGQPTKPDATTGPDAEGKPDVSTSST